MEKVTVKRDIINMGEAFGMSDERKEFLGNHFAKVAGDMVFDKMISGEFDKISIPAFIEKACEPCETVNETAFTAYMVGVLITQIGGNEASPHLQMLSALANVQAKSKVRVSKN